MRTPLSNKRTRLLPGFTLVELIVVITILAILGTIGFISIQGYSSSARDSARVSDVATIGKVIELTLVERGTAPMPFGAVAYTGGTVTLQVGTASSSAIPRLSAGVADPLSKKAYNYSVFGEGLYYQLGASYENAVSFNTGIPGIETVYADTSSVTSKLSGNYSFDPSLPSLFPIAGTVDSASGGIFSPDGCFVMNGSVTNSFGATSGTCVKKKDMALKVSDGSLVGYWDMETLTGGLLRDLSGNGNDGVCHTGISQSGSCTTYWPFMQSGSMIFNGTDHYIELANTWQVTSDTVTLEAKVKWQWTNGKSQRIISSQSNIAWTIRFSDNGTDVQINTLFRDSSGSILTVRSNTDVRYSTGSSYLITGVLNKNTILLYINGKLVNSWTFSNNSNFTPSNRITLWNLSIQSSAAYPDLSSFGEFFNGSIDSSAIYNRSLSETEIRQHAKVAGL